LAARKRARTAERPVMLVSVPFDSHVDRVPTAVRHFMASPRRRPVALSRTARFLAGRPAPA